MGSTSQLGFEFISAPKPQPARSSAYWALGEYKDGLRPDEYPLGHPWHYYLGGIPVPVERIPPADWTPHKPIKIKQISEEIVRAKQDLAVDIDRYNGVVKEGNGIEKGYNLDVCYSGDRLMARSSLIAFKYNHICNGKGRLIYLRRLKHSGTKRP